MIKKNFNLFENGVDTIDDNVQNDINQVHLPEFCTMIDYPHWAFDNKGKFTIKSMYN